MRKISKHTLSLTLYPVLLIAAAIVIYLPAMSGSFIWDDEISIAKNELLRHADGLKLFWTTIGTVPLEEHYWPVTYSVVWLQWRLWGGSATGFHLVNIIMHALVGIQIWRLMRRIGLPGAWLAGALFVVHPVNVESVAWIISIKGLLAALFYLLSIEFYLNHSDRGGRKWLILAMACAVAGMLSKSSPVMLPVALAILIWYRRGRIEKRNWLGLILIAEIVVLLAFIDMWVVRQSGENASALLIPPVSDRLARSGWTFWLYLEKLLWPANLGPFYQPSNMSGTHPFAWIPLIAAAAVTAALWVLRRRIGRGPLACCAYYGVSLAPVLGIVYFSFLRLSPAADRYQYIAMIGPVVGVAALAGAWIEQSPARVRVWRCIPALTILFVLAGLSFRQAGFYRDQETFFRHAVAVAPGSAEAHYDLAMTLMQKNPAGAENHLTEAIRLKPDHWPAVCNLGLLKISQNKFEEAAAIYNQALERGCADLGVLSNYAWMLAAAPEPAVRDPQQALALATQLMRQSREKDPDLFSIQSAALAAAGRFNDAIAAAQQGRQIAREKARYDQARDLDLMIRLYQNGRPFVMPRGPANQ